MALSTVKASVLTFPEAFSRIPHGISHQEIYLASSSDIAPNPSHEMGRVFCYGAPDLGCPCAFSSGSDKKEPPTLYQEPKC